MFTSKKRLKIHNRVTLQGKDGHIFFSRLQGGIPWVQAQSKRDAVYGQGWIHANDRQLHLYLTRIIVQGRLSELLMADPELVRFDTYIRRLQFAPDLKEEVARLDNDKSTKELLSAYCQGINDFTNQNGLVWELKLLGVKEQPWEIADSMLMAKAFTYIGLASVQTDIERFIVQLVQKGMDEKRLKALFPYLKDKLDLELLRKVSLPQALLPSDVEWLNRIPSFSASNNWVVGGKHTPHGMPILAGDPHLEINRLPAVWHENALSWKSGKSSASSKASSANTTKDGFSRSKQQNDEEGQEVIGVSLPGAAGILVGRNRHVSWAPTYSNMDMFDFRIEECRDGKYYRPQVANKNRGVKPKSKEPREDSQNWKDFKVRKEIIHLRKPIKMNGRKTSQVEVNIYENEQGVLEGDPYAQGYYLIGNWAARYKAGASDLKAFLELFDAGNAKEAMRCFQKVEAASYSWLIADSQGNMAYRMSGRTFRRPSGVSGLAAHAAWQSRYDSKGFVPSSELPQVYNPRSRLMATANNDLNGWGKTEVINACMADYRRDRIVEMLLQKEQVPPQSFDAAFNTALDTIHSKEETQQQTITKSIFNSKNKKVDMDFMQVMHYDLYSPQAAAFMPLIVPHLPESEQGRRLKQWDCVYRPDSELPTLFENIYSSLLRELFGTQAWGEQVVVYIEKETTLFNNYYGLFDAVLLNSRSPWFGKGQNSQKAVFAAAVKRGMALPSAPYATTRRILLAHLLFDKHLPTCLGFNRGPLEMPGSRGTLLQGQKINFMGRPIFSAPTYRFITDMQSGEVRFNAAGGISDRRFSGLYFNRQQDFMRGKYNCLNIQDLRSKR